MEHTEKSLTNAQLEILKAFSFNLGESELVSFRKVIADFFAKRAIESADEAWEQKGWSDAKVNELLNTKLRKSSK